MKIFKYTLHSDDGYVEIPLGSKILSCQMQHGKVCLWAKVNENEELDKRRFIVYATGETMDDSLNLKFIATVQDDVLVWHVFEVIPDTYYL